MGEAVRDVCPAGPWLSLGVLELNLSQAVEMAKQGISPQAFVEFQRAVSVARVVAAEVVLWLACSPLELFLNLSIQPKLPG